MIQYQLLRNNKETGPYTAQQLVQMGFKPYDLLWAEGRSAAWRYPSEIDELKPYAPAVEEQPYDRFYKKPVITQTKKDNAAAIETVSTTTFPAFSVETTASTSNSQIIQKEKPRIKIKADWKKIEPPIFAEKKEFPEIKKTEEKIEIKKTEPVVQKKVLQQKVKETTSWKDAWLDWEQEKKAVTAVSKNNFEYAEPKEEVLLETKFSQPFEDIQQQYAEILLRTKTKSKAIEWNRYKGYISVAVIFVPVLAVGMWLGLKWNNSTIDTNAIIKQQQEKLNQITATKSVEVNQEPENVNPQTNTSITEPAEKKNNNSTTPSLNKNTTQPVAKIIPKQSTSVVQKQLPSQVKTQSQFLPPTENDHHSLVVNNNNTSPSRVANRRNSNTGAIVPNTQQQNNLSSGENADNKNDDDATVSKKAPRFQSINDYITVNAMNTGASAPVQGVKFHVQNISEIPVDLVVMDIQYFDANGRFKKGETVYIHNISPGESATIKAPDDRLSSKITYKVSLVSAEQKGVYLIAD